MQYWTQEKTDKLVQDWKDGLSAALIADRLGGVTRNAVIGKAYRMGLDPRATYQRKPMAKRERRPVRIYPKRESRLSLVPVDATPLPPPHVTDIPRVSMLELEQHHCRWVCADFVNVETPQYCGCKKIEGLPYCENHARRAYQVPGMGQKQIANPRQPQRQMAIQGSVVADLRTLEEAV